MDDQKNADDAQTQEPTESMKSLGVFLKELSKQMVHQMAIMKDGDIHIGVTIKNRIISGMGFNLHNKIDF